ncbi:MAG: mannose-1-phosphate guanylyltransferase/mannose-6-phosphate isomerase [Desulfosarcina sp.]|nr:mannose-1-phosphate guanylyltransferase/mannose-6-phosphate isomerase [Desulfobacterales bacterium]
MPVCNSEGLNTYAILLAGGTGTRLWPVSRELYPKQLVKFIGEDSLVQSTIKRLLPVLKKEKVKIVCGREHDYEIARQMDETGIKSDGKVISEPCGRNTAPAILLAAFDVLATEDDAVLLIFPADHVIKDVNEFHNKIKSAIQLAEEGYIVTFGITPHYPETGYGYIEGSESHIFHDDSRQIKRFVEKPDKITAEKYLKAGNFFWNSGMFAFKASILIEEFKTHKPALLRTMEEIFHNNKPVTKTDYERLENISIDYAIMEKTDKGVVLPSDFGWSDIGSWKSLYDFLEKDHNNNVIDGDVIARNIKRCFIKGHERLVAVSDLENIAVIETPDSVFVSNLDNSREVKDIVTKLKEKERREYHRHKFVHQPWGIVTSLEQKKGYSVKRLLVYPEKSVEFVNSGITNFTVIKGCMVISYGSNSQTCNPICKKGESFTLSDKNTVKILNNNSSPLCVIQVEIG